MKSLLGADHLAWDANQQQGAYEGKPVYDHNRHDTHSTLRATSIASTDFSTRRETQQHSSSDVLYGNPAGSYYETSASAYGTRTGARDQNYPSHYAASRPTSAAEARMNTNRGQGSSGVFESLQPDSPSRPTQSRYGQNPVPLSQAARQSQSSVPPENARSLAAFTSRKDVDTTAGMARGSAQEARSTRPW